MTAADGTRYRAAGDQIRDKELHSRKSKLLVRYEDNIGLPRKKLILTPRLKEIQQQLAPSAGSRNQDGLSTN